jgi:hypothetical protein
MMKTNPLEDFRQLLVELREKNALSQGKLEELLWDRVGKEQRLAKIISLWESGARRKYHRRYHLIVDTLDKILGAEGELSRLFRPHAVKPVLVLKQINVPYENIQLMVGLSRLLPNGLEDTVFTAKLIDGLIEFFVRTGLPVSDTEHHRELINSAIMIARSAKANQNQEKE